MDLLSNTKALRLSVKLLTGEVHSIDVSTNQTVWDFKTKIAQRFGVSPYQQKLACQNNTQINLRDGALLSEYGLHSGDTILLIVKNEESIPILLKNARGTTSTYYVMPSDTVAAFRTRVQQQERIHDGQLWLTYEGKPLEDHCKFSDYNVAPHSTIYLHLRLRGGGELVVGSASGPDTGPLARQCFEPDGTFCPSFTRHH